MTNMNMHIDIHKHYFDLTVRQSHSYDKETGKDITVSLFNMTLRQNDDFISFNLTHYLRDEQCFTAIRKGVISRKCYGGYGEGGALVGKTHDNPPRRFDSVYQIRPNTTRCVYDGLRGSGFYWQWVWAMASGFSKPEFYSKKNHIEKERWIGLNFGHLNQAG